MATAVVEKIGLRDASIKKKKIRSSFRRISVDAKEQLERCMKTVGISKRQLRDLLDEFENMYSIELSPLESQSLTFLTISKQQKLSILFLAEHLKKYDVIVEQMVTEIQSIDDRKSKNYNIALQDAGHQIKQLTGNLKIAALLLSGGKDGFKDGRPTLPEDLKIEKKPSSKRPLRDGLVIKHYKQLLQTIEVVIKKTIIS